jgi:hypothetical protein
MAVRSVRAVLIGALLAGLALAPTAHAARSAPERPRPCALSLANQLPPGGTPAYNLRVARVGRCVPFPVAQARKRGCRAKAQRNHNPRVGGSSPSSGIRLSPVFRAVAAVSRGIHWVRATPTNPSEPLGF